MAWLQSVALSLYLFVGFVVFVCFPRPFRNRSRRIPLPPGPRGLPLIGNLLDYPKVLPWLRFKDMSRKYGNIISLKAFGFQFIVLNDFKAAVDLLERRSAIYSSRPTTRLFKLSGWGWSFALMPYGPWWRQHRRAFWQHFHPGVVGKYNARQEESARELLSRLLRTPKDFAEHIEYSIGKTIIETCYGLPVAREGDKYVKGFKAAASTLDFIAAGSYVLLDVFPMLARIPTWLPGTNALRRLERAREVVGTVREMPWTDFKEAMVNTADVKSSVAGAILEELSNSAHDPTSSEEVGKNVTALAYFAALDTTHSMLTAFVFVVSLYPDVQAKAQTELDRVVGRARLPGIADMESLPYINAIVKEVLRWHAATPLSVAHVTTADDDYNGYFIPKGSVVVPNTWAFLHDPEVYPDPDTFIPERFLKDGKLAPHPRDPVTAAFGYGRRICPGRHYAATALFIYIASILHTFDITPPVDEHGKPISIQPRWTSEPVSHLEDCRCTLAPRSAWAEALIRRDGADVAVSN